MLHRFTVCILSLAGAVASAQPHGGDIILATDNGRIVTRVDNGAGPEPACTYESEFGVGDYTDEPGFDTEVGAFQPGIQIGFSILTALREWDGTSFDSISDERIELSWGPLGPIASPLTDDPVTGFALGVSDNGEFHYHYDFQLTGPADPGVYLLTLQMWSDDGGLGTSEPLAIIFNQGMDETVHEAAIEWWTANGAWCTADPCVADFNGDGAVNTQDFIAYLNAWSSGDSRADFNGDGTVNTQDFIAYLNLWSAGC